MPVTSIADGYGPAIPDDVSGAPAGIVIGDAFEKVCVVGCDGVGVIVCEGAVGANVESSHDVTPRSTNDRQTNVRGLMVPPE
jgi:hypothetical protein